MKQNIFKNKNKFIELYRIFEIKKNIKTELNSLQIDFWNQSEAKYEINSENKNFEILRQKQIENSSGQFLGIDFEIAYKEKIFRYRYFFNEINLGK